MDVTTVEPTITASRTTEHPVRLRIIGAATAMGLSGLVAAIGALDLDARAVLTLGGLVGIPVGGVMGWRHAPTVRSMAAREAFERTLRIGLVSVLLGALGVATVMVFPSFATGSDVSAILAGLALWLFALVIGLVIFGLPAFALAVVVMWPWSFVIRHLPRRLAGDAPAR